eukprot:CAMPEP_0117655902 /NCGR_PEP_ID=MMETSP0804-20121206/4522_1 /TAXON_ID=1074897 /ORGANISM="Tetraselmis astigmatica, Strain CCMP880" /LENGTH=124 /DNA_ID=CAMNT_0005462275 /DNA_START=309 /DNA_END=684 /DNA_ORIENTATION=+
MRGGGQGRTGEKGDTALPAMAVTHGWGRGQRDESQHVVCCPLYSQALAPALAPALVLALVQVKAKKVVYVGQGFAGPICGGVAALLLGPSQQAGAGAPSVAAGRPGHHGWKEADWIDPHGCGCC